jgi:hypothetical protein
MSEHLAEQGFDDRSSVQVGVEFFSKIYITLPSLFAIVLTPSSFQEMSATFIDSTVVGAGTSSPTCHFHLELL